MSGLKSLTSLLKIGHVPISRPARAYIIPLNIRKNDAIMCGNVRYFQYFPESIRDVKQVNYQNRDIPGLSHPLYSWTSGGPREISFTAVFTRDSMPSVNSLNLFSNSEYSNDVLQTEEDQYNVDICAAVSWLRSFMYPEVSIQEASGSPGARPFPPRKLILGLPGVNISPYSSGAVKHEMCCFMRTCDVNYEAFFPNGSPRIAKVTLLFVETMQRASRISLHDARDVRLASANYMGRPNRT